MDPDVASIKNWTARTLTDRAGQWLGTPAANTTQLVQELDDVNRKLRSVPSTGRGNAKIARASFLRTRWTKLLQIGICVAISVFLGAVIVASKISADSEQREFGLSHLKPLLYRTIGKSTMPPTLLIFQRVAKGSSAKGLTSGGSIR